MKIYLGDLQQSMVDAWSEALADAQRGWKENFDIPFPHDIEIVKGPLFDMVPKVEAAVSPANSFGFMTGGIDLYFSHFFGWDLQKAVMEKIYKHHNGELLVGQATLVPTRHPDVPFLIAAPTMRVPHRLPADTVAPFLATRAVMRLCRDEEGVDSVAFSGMGTGTGGVSPELCANQMMHAFLNSGKKLYTSHREMLWDHQNLIGIGWK